MEGQQEVFFLQDNGTMGCSESPRMVLSGKLVHRKPIRNTDVYFFLTFYCYTLELSNCNIVGLNDVSGFIYLEAFTED